MTRRYKTLQRKLQALESSLAHLFSVHPEANNPSHHPLLLSDVSEITQQFVFVKKLLSAEISSHPSKPHHLAHISGRLDQLEVAFRHYQDHRNDHVDDITDCGAIDGLDAASTCSCTESCLNDDGEEEADLGSELNEEPETFHDPALVEEEEEEEEKEEEKAPVEFGSVEIETMNGGVTREKEGDRFWVGGCFRVLGGGVVIGAVLMWFVMVNFSGSFHYIEHEGFLIPT